MGLNIVDLVPAQQKGVPRDGRDKPLVIPEQGGKPVALTRTTTFIDCLEDKEGLAKWKQRLTLVGLREQPSLLEAAAGLDHEDETGADKRKLDALVKRALDAAGIDDRADWGTRLHDFSEYVDRGEPLPAHATEEDVADMAAYASAMVWLTPVHREVFTVCSELATGGTPDIVAWYDGPGPDGEPFEGLLIVDLKTGSVEYGGLKMPMQLGIYSRSKLYDHSLFPAPIRAHSESEWNKWKRTVVPAEEAAKAYTPLGPVNQEWGLVINVPAGTGQAELFWADLTLGWAAAQMALDVRGFRKRAKDGLRPWVPPTRTVIGLDTAGVGG